MKLFKILLVLFFFGGMPLITTGAKSEIQKQEIRGDTVAPVQVLECSFCLFESPAPEMPPGFTMIEEPRFKEPRKTNLSLHIDPG